LLLGAGAWLHFSRLPLRRTDLWGHLAYGRWLDQHGIPQVEPLLPEVQTGPYVDSAWLTQWLWFRLYQLAGLASLPLLHSLLTVLTGGLVVWAGWRLTRSWWAGTVAGLFWISTTWFQLQVIRPQLGGGLCAALSLVWLCRRGPLRPGNAALPSLGIIFVLWANLHGSFVMGWMWLLVATGCAWWAVWRQPPDSNSANIPAPPSQRRPDERSARHLLWGLVLALAAVWINPYGGRLPAAVLDIAGNNNLRDLSEWQPLRLTTTQGRVFLASLALLAATGLGRAVGGWRSGHPVSRWFRATPAWLALCGLLLAGATLRSARFIVWWGPLGGLWLATLLPRRTWPAGSTGWWRPRLAWWLLPALAWGIALGRSPVGTGWRTGQTRRLERLVDPQTPVALGEFLHTQAPAGRLFCPIEWGDYLQWRMPQSEHHPILFGSHVHLLPSALWRDYLAVVGRKEEWPEVLDRLQIETVVLDQAGRSRLMAELDRHPGWERIYTDPLGAVWRRVPVPPNR
jgi:hypothetical protein